jgi:hypothetical protein
VVIIGGIYFFAKGPAEIVNDPQNVGPAQNEAAEGRVVFSVTDEAVDINTVSEINIRVTSVEIHSNVNGWVTVSNTPQTYSLLELNADNESKVLADVLVKASTYDQVRLVVDSISVETKAGVTKEARLPANQITIDTTLVVNPDTTSSVNFDFLADKSLHVTDDKNYIFAPVVKTETRSDASIAISADNVVTIAGGRLDTANIVGMDIDGSIKVNFEIDSEDKLKIDGDSIIKVGI